jgi:acyl-CoA-binding protein
MEGRAKWDARKGLIGTDRVEAQAKYIAFVQTLVEKYGLRD